jgi:hypothetical protein
VEADAMNATEEPRAVPETQAAILHRAMLKKVLLIKARRGGSVADIVSRHADAGIDAEYRECLAEADAELGGEG